MFLLVLWDAGWVNCESLITPKGRKPARMAAHINLYCYFIMRIFTPLLQYEGYTEEML